MSERELFNYFNKPVTKICGKFHSNQLGYLKNPASVVKNGIPKTMAATVMLSLAVFSDSNAQKPKVNQNTTVENRPIALTPVESNAANESEYTITGKILDESNVEGLGGVTVNIKNTRNGVLSDLNGYFSLKCTSKNSSVVTLQFSFIGFVTEERTVELSGNEIQLGEIKMTEDNVMLLGEVCIINETKSKGFWLKLKNIFNSNK
ncbi:carboxypeptidase-like regulatory domain-containing protein [Reichenbachiella sp. MALMAid0571]|uniref:carboxypeptidase-like regulatory domain-containing protein n=1 Tax=Reichenbachiella sp. MALMAid0571 TaxID=3143939 RepID=UPI0032E0084E